MGPLTGVKILEIAGLGPGPFAGMLLADMGATMIRIERPGGTAMGSGRWNLLNRGRPSAAVDLKDPRGRQIVLELCQGADALIEGFRPGVMERLGLGPEEVLERNPRLVYGRMTGYGQDGPLSQVAGHDINYLAIAGALGSISRDGGRPVPPLNLVGDMGGGGLLLAFGVVCAVLEARASGQGQVVDAAMVDGTSILSTIVYAFRAAQDHPFGWDDRPGRNMIDTGAHFYDAYETSDGGYMAVGAVEPEFYAEFIARLGLDADDMPQWDRPRWPELKRRVAERFASRTLAEWTEVFEEAEACTSPVLRLDTAPEHRHNVARGSFVEVDGVLQPRPAPRFSRTEAEIAHGPRLPGEDTDAALAAWGVGEDALAALRAAAVIA
jgi:alpha-methylacyl-CoA racemase